MDEETARDLASRGRDIRRAARMPLADVAAYLGMPPALLGRWEKTAPVPAQLSRRDTLARQRWTAFLQVLEKDLAG